MHDYDRRRAEHVEHPTVLLPGRPRVVDTTDEEMMLSAMSIRTEAGQLVELIPHGTKSQIDASLRRLEAFLKTARTRLGRWPRRHN